MIVLHDLILFNGDKVNISISDRVIVKESEFNNTEKKALRLHFENSLAFPGLINSHDHLEFNLFPKLGNKIYDNYLDWGTDIHFQNKKEISGVLAIPEMLRAQWGIYKNLLNGITTVVQHGKTFRVNDAIINVIQNTQSLHSVGLEKNWRFKLNNPFKKNIPCVIHLGEGTDGIAFNEINELLHWNLLHRKLVAVHAIAMNPEQAKNFEAIIWCPDSNFFLQNKTAGISKLKKETKIVFGTDSTLSASWNIWDQLRLARTTNMLTNEELFASITSTAAEMWKLNTGAVIEGKNADIVIAKMKDTNSVVDSFYAINPEDIQLVICNGDIKLFDKELVPQIKDQHLKNTFSEVYLNNVCKFVKGDVPALIKKIKQYNSEIKFPVHTD